MTRLQNILRHLSPGRAALLCFLLLMIGNLPYLADPPFWDDLLGLHRQALFLARHHFSFSALAASGDFWSGGAWIYKLNWPSLLYGGLYTLFPPLAVHILGHLLNCGLLAGSAGIVFQILRGGGVSAGNALLWSLAMISEPLLSTQSAGIGQEIMLVFCLTAFLAAFQQDRNKWCLFWLLAAALIKPAAAIPAAAWGIVSGLKWLHCRSKRNLLRLLAAGLLCLGLALMLWIDSDGAASGGWALAGRLQNMYSAFPLLVLLAVVSVCGGLRHLIREGRDAEILLYLCWILLFFAGYLTYSVPLPRYGAALVPVCVLTAARTCLPRSGIPALLLLAAGLLMQNGTGYPPIAGPHRHSGEFLERNRQILRQVELDRKMCAFLEQYAADHPVVAKWPYIQMLAEPGFGYVKKALPRLHCAGIVPEDFKNVQEYPVSGLAKTPEPYYIFVCNSFEFFRDFGPPLAPERGDLPVWIPESAPDSCLIYRKGVK